MASISRRPNGRWRARYRDLDGREHARHFVERDEAQRWLDDVTVSLEAGWHLHPKAGQVTFRAYAEA